MTVMIFTEWPSAQTLADVIHISEGAAECLLDAIAEYFEQGSKGIECLNFVIDRQIIIEAPDRISNPKYLERLSLYLAHGPAAPARETPT